MKNFCCRFSDINKKNDNEHYMLYVESYEKVIRFFFLNGTEHDPIFGISYTLPKYSLLH